MPNPRTKTRRTDGADNTRANTSADNTSADNTSADNTSADNASQAAPAAAPTGHPTTPPAAAQSATLAEGGSLMTLHLVRTLPDDPVGESWDVGVAGPGEADVHLGYYVDSAETITASLVAADGRWLGSGIAERGEVRSNWAQAATPTDVAEATEVGAAATQGPARRRADAAAGSVADRVGRVLQARAGVTAAELATAAGVGRSTVAKLLAAWAGQGHAVSAPGDTPRAARRWTATTPGSAGQPTTTPITAPATEPADRPTLATSSDTPQPGPAGPAPGAAGGMARPTGRARSGVNAGRARLAAAAAVPGQPASPGRAAVARTSSTNRNGSARLAAGELRGLVEEFLTENPGPRGPVEIGHALRRSSGAIANALERLVETGWAERTDERPKRYQLAAEDAADEDAADEAAAEDDPDLSEPEDAEDVDGKGDDVDELDGQDAAAGRTLDDLQG